MVAPQVKLRTAALTVGTFRNVYIMRIHGCIEMEDLLASHQVHLDLIASGARSTGVLAIAKANVPIPDAEVRDASSRLMRELSPYLLAGATVIDGGGFWASAVRSFLTAVYFVAKQPCPTKAFGSVEEACEWLGPRVSQIPSQLVGASQLVLQGSADPGVIDSART
jgi:hypothetical protein